MVNLRPCVCGLGASEAEARAWTRVSVLLILGVGAFMPSVAAARQDAWIDRMATGPSARESHAVAFDSARGEAVLFGGYANGDNDETWTWNGSVWDWKQVSGPSPRRNHAMAYDSARGVTVLFGGLTGGGNGETWEWDGNAWNQIMVSGPSPRWHHMMSYDELRGVTVLFGGFDGSRNGETWEWDGASWMLRSVSGPTPRYRHSMAYDAARGETVLFGGYDGADNGETWTWNGAVWSQRVGPGPSARRDHAMAYDSARGVIVLFGGLASAINGETWEWNGGGWSQRTLIGPGPLRNHAMAFDSARNVAVLVGGFSANGAEADTWELCSAPSIERPPVSQTTCNQGSASFILVPAGSSPYTFAWQWQPGGVGAPWVNLAAGANSDAGGTPVVDAADVGTSKLTVRPLPGYTAFAPRAFRCLVGNSCGSVVSETATLTVCAADFNCDGFLDFFDYDDFVGCFETANCPPDTNADFNGDGFADFFDYDDFVRAFEGGC